MLADEYYHATHRSPHLILTCLFAIFLVPDLPNLLLQTTDQSTKAFAPAPESIFILSFVTSLPI